MHAFPNIKIDSTVFPVRLSDLESVHVDVEWTYGLGNRTASSTDEDELALYNVNTNVALDMFLDSDKKTARDSRKARYELMVWLAAIGAATHPIGLPRGAMATEVLDGVALYVFFFFSLLSFFFSFLLAFSILLVFVLAPPETVRLTHP